MRLTNQFHQEESPGGGKDREGFFPRWFACLLAIVVPALAGAVAVGYSVRGLAYLGWSVFVVLPVLLTALSAFLSRLFHPVSWAVSYGQALLSIILLGVILIMLAVDGAVCLLMALPLTTVLAVAGTLVGYHLGAVLSGDLRKYVPLWLVLLFPAFQGFEKAYETEPPMREVMSRVTIDAPIGKVWDEVIAFDRITKPPEGILRWGIAYPIQAKIYGEGVGAVRHCIFSTGPFVEPITVWEPPYRLEFDVTSNPPPMNELSPYGHIDVPHLHGTFVSKHGRFRLWEEDGKVVLEGTTWYYQKIAPDWYWHVISDAIIHKIHLRVLEQIREQSEMAVRDGGRAKRA